MNHNLSTVTVKMYKPHISNRDFELELRYSIYTTMSQQKTNRHIHTLKLVHPLLHRSYALMSCVHKYHELHVLRV